MLLTRVGQGDVSFTEGGEWWCCGPFVLQDYSLHGSVACIRRRCFVSRYSLTAAQHGLHSLYSRLVAVRDTMADLSGLRIGCHLHRSRVLLVHQFRAVWPLRRSSAGRAVVIRDALSSRF